MQQSSLAYRHGWLLLILLLAASLRLYHLDFQSVWDDEIATMIEADPKLSFAEARHLYMNFDNMPPLYFAIMRLLFMLFGHTSLVLRIFSALAGIAGVWAIYLLGKNIYGRSAGLAAALLLAVNTMHIQYSQEGRPYTYFVLFTILSFNGLILLVQKPGYRNALLYGLLAALMLYGQYLALILLFAQALLLLYYLLTSEKTGMLKFFKCCLLSLATVIILYIPALPQFLRNVGIKSSWIPMPGTWIYHEVYDEFFGHSEMLMSVIFILLMVFFIALFRDPSKDLARKPGLTMAFVIVVAWVSTYALVLLLRSYLVLPMIISRYMIVLLPAVLLLAGIGLSQSPNILVRAVFLLLACSFSLSTLFVVKNYYFKLSKPQYREAAQFISNNRNPTEPVVARVGWHYGLFFPDITWLKLEDYLNNLMKGASSADSFWYAGVHDQDQQLSNEKRRYLEDNFYVDKSRYYHATQAIRFKRYKDGTTWVNPASLAPLKTSNDGAVELIPGRSATTSFTVPPGSYVLAVSGTGWPSPAIKGENARLTILINRKQAGIFELKDGSQSLARFNFTNSADDTGSIELLFENPGDSAGVERQAIINSLFIEKR